MTFFNVYKSINPAKYPLKTYVGKKSFPDKQKRKESISSNLGYKLNK